MTFIAFAAAGALAVPLLLIIQPHQTSGQVSHRSDGSLGAASASVAEPAAEPAARPALDSAIVPAAGGRGRSPTEGGPGAAAAGPARVRSPGSAVITWSWPMNPRPVVVRGFSIGAHPWDPGHRGVDLAAVAGTPVLAPAGGRIHFAGELAGRPVLSIDHGHGVLSSFEPVVSTLRVGTPVEQGEVVGHLGAGRSHCSPASCLHWGVRENGQYVDPLTLPGIWRGRVVLLPLGSAG
jgi:murein DD-endopeptidase MepM/ murein hydrolase activator NlpD